MYEIMTFDEKERAKMSYPKFLKKTFESLNLWPRKMIKKKKKKKLWEGIERGIEEKDKGIV